MASTAEEYRKKWGLNEDGTPIAAAAPSAQQSVYGPKYRDPELEAYRQKWGDQYAIPQPPEPERDYDTGIGYAFMRGLERLRAMPDVAQGDYEELAQHYGNMENWRMSDEDIAKFEEMRNTEGWWAKAGQLFQNPRLVMQVVAESLPMMAAPIAGAIAGGFAGGALTGGNPLGAAGGAMAGGGVGSFYTEYFNAVGEYLSDKAGVDLRNPQQLKAAFEDETLMQGAREWARKRGIPIAVFDALSMGLAGRIAKPVSGVVGKVTGGRRIGAGTAAEITSQAGFGAAGEAGAQLYSEGEIKDELDVLLEGFAEIVPGFAEAAVSRYTDRRAEARRDRKPSDESPIDSLNQPPDETPPPLYGGEADTSDAAMEAAGDRLYEDLGEEGPNTPQRDELDILLEDLGKQLEQDLATRAAKDEYEATAQARRNTEMIALEEERAIQREKQRQIEERRKTEQERQMWADKEVTDALAETADLEGRAVPGPARIPTAVPDEPDSELVTPRGTPIEGEPVDVIGGQPAEGMRGPEGTVYEAGGRPRGTSLADALREAGLRGARPPEPPDGPTGGGGAPAAPEPAPAAPEPTEAVSEAVEAEPEPAVEWADPRMRREEYREGLRSLVYEVAAPGENPVGLLVADLDRPGVTSADDATEYKGRLPSVNPKWVQEIVDDLKPTTVKGEGIKGYIDNVIEKAIAGKRLGKVQRDVLDRLLEQVRLKREEDAAALRAQLPEGREERRMRREDKREREAIQAEGMGDIEDKRPLSQLAEAEIPFAPVTDEERAAVRERAKPPAEAPVEGEVEGRTVPTQFDMAEQNARMMPTSEAIPLMDPNVPLDELEKQEGPYLDNLAKRIINEGWENPIEITVDEDGNPDMIFDGNHRVAAAKRAGIKEVPYIYIAADRDKLAITQVQRLNGRLLQEPDLTGQEQFETNADAKAFSEALEKNGWTFVEDVLGGYYEKDGHTVSVEQNRKGQYVMNVRGREADALEQEAPPADLGVKGDLFSETANRQIDVEEQTELPGAAESRGKERFTIKGEYGTTNEYEVVWAPGSTRVYEVKKGKRGDEITNPTGLAFKRGKAIADEARGGEPRIPPDPTDVELRGTDELYDIVLDMADFRNPVPIKNAKVGDTIFDTRETRGKDADPRYGYGVVLDVNKDTGSKLVAGFQSRGPLVDPARGNKKVTHPAGLYFESIPYQDFGVSHSPDYKTLGEVRGEFREAGRAEVEAEQREVEDVTHVDSEGNVTFQIDEEQFNEVIDEYEYLAETPPKNKRTAIDTKLKNSPFIPLKEAQKKVDEWKRQAREQSKQPTYRKDVEGYAKDDDLFNPMDNSQRIVISLFDYTGQWARPWAEAGYDVYTFDIKSGQDAMDFSVEWFANEYNFDKEIYAIIAAPPCTTFSNSGTRWRKSRHDAKSKEVVEEMWGPKAVEQGFEIPNEYGKELVAQTMRVIEYFRPKVWALENPEGRIEAQAGLQGWRTAFQPHNFGDPYTKRTLLWGNFNEDMPTANVEPTEGSKMHKMSPSEERAALRSETPEGFSYAFFVANNYNDRPLSERLPLEFPEIAGAISEAIRAGLTEPEIRNAAEYAYLDDRPEDAAEALRDLIGKKPPPDDEGPGGGTPVEPPTPSGPPIVSPGVAGQYTWDGYNLGHMTLMMEELDPNRHQQMWQFYDKETKEGGLGRVTFNKMFRGRPWYTVEARKDGDWTVVGEVRQRPKNKDGLEWAVYEDGKEVDRWHDFAHAAANVPGAANEDMSDRWAQKRRNEYKSGKRLRSKSPEFRGEVPPVVEIPKAEGTTNEKFEFIPSEAEIERAASEIDTEASEAQLRAGNAKKGHTKFAGFDITFEHRPDLKDDNAQYGYIKRTKGADGEQVDVFVNKKAEKDWAGDIYVVDQYTEDGNFDEHKVMLGYNNLLDAKRSYRKAYGRQANNITKLTQNEFKAWLAEAGSNKRPAIETSVTEAGRKERESGQNRLRFSSGKNLLATSDEEFIKAVLKTSEQNLGDMPDTMPLNIAVSELLTMQEREQAQTTSGEDITGAVTMDEVFPPGKIEKEVAAINKEFPGAEIILAERADPQIQARIADQLGERHSNVPALYDPATKTIYIFKDRLNPITPSIRKLALHEMVHKGLDNMFDAHNDPRGRVEYNELMDDIYERVPSKYKPLLKKIELEYELEPKVYPEDRRIAAEELVANLAERDVKEGIVARVIKFVRNFLERIGMITKEDAWTNEDIRKLIAEAHGAIEVKDRSNRVMLTEEVTVAETGEVYEVELPASELLNEIEQRKAMCEKVRACL